MRFVRLFLRGLLIVVISFALGVGIGLATLQATLFNKSETKSWLANSGVYDHLVDSLVRPQSSAQGSAEEIIDPATLKKALGDTFPPTYVQQQIEMVLDNSYSWLEGKTDTFHFTIHIAEKREEFTKNLAAALEPKIAQLPTCASRFNETSMCIPPGVSKAEFANQLAGRAQEGSAMLDQPITEQSLGQNQQQKPASTLPQLYQATPILIMAAGAVVLLGATAYVFLSDSKLRGLVIISRRITLGTLITLILGIAIWYLGSSMQLSATIGAGDQQQAQILSKLIDPILQQALPVIGIWMMIISGCVIAVAGSSWLAAFLFMRKQKQEQQLASAPAPQANPPGPPPPTQPLP